MREMKDSGMIRLKYVVDIFGRIGFRGYTEQDLVDENEGAITLSPSNIQNMKMDYSKCSFLTWQKYYESPEIKIKNGDVLFVKTGSTYGKVGYVENLPMEATINPQLVVFKNISMNSKLLFYMLQMPLVKDQCELAVVGGTIPTMSQVKIGNIYIPSLPLNEQQRIAEFLDRECGKIDGLKENIQSQIDTLEQYKRSVITEAVTHGLNPSAPMKDSRISWVGDIPQNWEIKRLKYLFKFCKGLPITKDNLIDQGLPVISYGQIHAKTNNGVDVRSHLLRFVDFSYQTFYPLSQVMRGDFVFADTSEDYEGCGNCVYKRNDSLLFAGYHTIIAHSIVESDNRFFAYLFQTDIWRKQIREKVSGVKVFSITQKTLSNTYMILPPLDEQQEIADYLDNKCAEIEQIIADKKSQIETLDGYKKSLIYEYVTGKKEVYYV